MWTKCRLTTRWFCSNLSTEKNSTEIYFLWQNTCAPPRNTKNTKLIIIIKEQNSCKNIANELSDVIRSDSAKKNENIILVIKLPIIPDNATLIAPFLPCLNCIGFIGTGLDQPKPNKIKNIIPNVLICLNGYNESIQ